MADLAPVSFGVGVGAAEGKRAANPPFGRIPKTTPAPSAPMPMIQDARVPVFFELTGRNEYGLELCKGRVQCVLEGLGCVSRLADVAEA